MRKFFLLLFCGLMLVYSGAEAQFSSQNNARLRAFLDEHPDADADGDGVLTLQEVVLHPAAAGMARNIAGRMARTDAGAAGVLDVDAEFQKVAEELDREMEADNEAALKEGPLSYEKGNGLRILMTGHSWVGPGKKTLPLIAEAAGYDGHQQRHHGGGGIHGSAPYVWESETIGREGKKRQILLPAIATGQWDVMTWGVFVGDTPQDYMKWISLCLKYNQDMVFYIQDGWPTYKGETANLSKEEQLADIDRTQQQIQDFFVKGLYDALEAKYPGKVRIIPAGAAVVAMHHLYHEGKLPGFDCVSEHLGGTKGIYRDGGHMSRSSGMEHLIGYLYYGMLYKKSPALIKGYAPEGIPAEVDAILRDVAWKSIVSSPYSGVKDKDEDGIADGSGI